MDVITQRHWLAKLTRLRVDRKSGYAAPHKPLLLLVIIELAEQGLLPSKVLALTPELAFRFCTYASVVTYRRTQAPDVRYRFYHMQSDGFWKALGDDKKEAAERRRARFAEFNPEFEACLLDSTFREEARKHLIATFFPKDEWPALCALVGVPAPGAGEIAESSLGQSPEQSEQRGREARFRINVASNYNYTCALTGYRLLTIDSGSIIDAAHIHQFADSRNSDIRNGIALCKNAHWLFDIGLWTIADDYTVKVAPGCFVEDSPDQKALSDYDGQLIRLPSSSAAYPDPVHLDWHRKKKFLGGD
jgi:putative restriction endonuclease